MQTFIKMILLIWSGLLFLNTEARACGLCGTWDDVQIHFNLFSALRSAIGNLHNISKFKRMLGFWTKNLGNQAADTFKNNWQNNQTWQNLLGQSAIKFYGLVIAAQSSFSEQLFIIGKFSWEAVILLVFRWHSGCISAKN
jgi:hypothetical protein